MSNGYTDHPSSVSTLHTDTSGDHTWVSLDGMLATDPDKRPDLEEICAISEAMTEKYAKLKSDRKEREGKMADAGGKSKK